MTEPWIIWMVRHLPRAEVCDVIVLAFCFIAFLYGLGYFALKYLGSVAG